MCFPSLRFMMVSIMSFVVMTFPLRCWRASFTSSTLTFQTSTHIISLISHFFIFSSASTTYWVTKWFNFSGRKQNFLPISLGLSFSTYHMWRISLTFPRKFQASWVHGLAIFTLHSSNFSPLNWSSSGSFSGSSLFKRAYCFKEWTLSLIAIRPVNEGQRRLCLELTGLNELNSVS